MKKKGNVSEAKKSVLRENPKDGIKEKKPVAKRPGGKHYFEKWRYAERQGAKKMIMKKKRDHRNFQWKLSLPNTIVTEDHVAKTKNMKRENVVAESVPGRGRTGHSWGERGRSIPSWGPGEECLE